MDGVGLSGNNIDAADFEEYVDWLKEILLLAYEAKKNKIDYNGYSLILKKALDELYDTFI